MKRWISVLLAALLVLSGCGAPAAVPEEAAPAAADLAAVREETPDPGTSPAATLAQPVYPDSPAHQEEGLTEADVAALNRFAEASTPLVLSGREGENAVYSPLSLWSALALLAQCTAGDSRAQILEAMEADGMEELPAQVSRVWRGLYTDDGKDSLLLANSIWLNGGLDGRYVQETLDTLAEQYYTGVFSVPMGTLAADNAVTGWVSEQTNGLIGGDGPVVQTFADTVMLLVSSLYYRAGWDTEFWSWFTKPDVFTNASGAESEIDFMRREDSGNFLRREGYQAAALHTRLGEMVFLLPDEGVAPETLLQDGDLLPALDFSGSDAVFGTIKWSVPKFDVDSALDLMDALAALGITDPQDPDRADFSSLTTLDAVLTRAEQLARVKVDEEGVEAAAVTILAVDGCVMPPMPEEVCVMDLDRPFLFVIRMGGVPLFVGVVNQVG